MAPRQTRLTLALRKRLLRVYLKRHAIDMAIAAGKLMLTMMHSEMLFVAHVHQPIIASPAVRVDDAVEGYRAPDRSL